MRVISIPEDRVGVLIGRDGRTLDKIRELVQADIKVHGRDVEIDSEDPLEELRAINIVKAIGRGFTPEKAFRLLEENSSIAIIKISDFGGNDRNLERLKGRVIGRRGAARNKIENITDTEICVYGKTVSVLGPMKGVEIAKKAIEMLLNGSSHGNVYRYVENNIEKVL